MTYNEHNECGGILVDDYGHKVNEGDRYISGHYLEIDVKSSTKKGYCYRLASKTAFIHKESIVCPHVDLQEVGNNRYFITMREFSDILVFMEKTCMAYL